jgi:hypothetical protein
MLKARLCSHNDACTKLWWGFLQGIKRGCAPAVQIDIRTQMLKHKKILCEPPTTPQDVIDTYKIYARRSLWTFKKGKEPELFEASTSASYESKNSQGGQREFVRQHFISAGYKQDEVLDYIEVRPPTYEVVPDGIVFSQSKIKEVKGFKAPLFSEVLDWAVSEETKVQVSPVLEPLKVRLISKGNAARYYISKFFQKEMWGYLQKFPQFSLTGSPLETSDLYALLQREKPLNLKFDKWVSGDYSSATDHVDTRMTMMVFEMMLDHTDYSEKLKDVLRSVIGPQDIEYPSRYHFEDGKVRTDQADPLSSFRQRNGQLMGSPLSFPILCLINLISYWKALEDYLGLRIPMDKLPVLINGDDILFRANDDFYKIWKKRTSEVGFDLSLGKNYIHKDFLTVNSKLYRYQSNGDFKYIGFLNVGLLTGVSKIAGRENQKILPVWDFFNKTVHQSANPERSRRRFLHYHKENISKFSFDGLFNLFLPLERGGLGFERRGLTNRLTSYQRRFATELQERYFKQVENLKIDRSGMVGIVKKHIPGQPSPIVYEGQRQLYVEKKFSGPMKVNHFVAKNLEYKLPILAQTISAERPIYSVKLPKSLNKNIRACSAERMDKRQIYSWPYRLCEIRVAQDQLKSVKTDVHRFLDDRSEIFRSPVDAF